MGKNESEATWRQAISKIMRFVTADVWRIRAEDLPRHRSFALRHLRILILALRGFSEDKIHLRASALTFFSLLSIVPVVAMAFGVAKGFGFERLLQNQIIERFPGQEEIVMRVIGFAHNLLETTKGGLVAGIGLIALFWAVLKVLNNIEASFNHLWGVKEERTIGRKFSDYLSILIVAPILVIMSSSVTVFVTTQITLITEKIALLGYVGPLIFLLLKLLPLCVIWLLFTIVYIIMPNTKVNFLSGFLGAVVAGTLYVFAQLAYIKFQIGVARYNAIYGSFAALPLFLVWLQLSWMIVLFGAEYAFAHQNVNTYEWEPDSLLVSSYYKRLLALEIAHLLIKNFAKGKSPLTADEISHRLGIPVRLMRQILYELVQSGIVSEINTESYKESAHQPARDISTLRVKDVMTALDRSGVNHLAVSDTESLRSLKQTLRAFERAIEESPANKLMKDI